MKKYFWIFILVFGLLSTKSFSQPFADIVSFNYQTFSSQYKSTSAYHNRTDDYFLNFFLPKVFKNGNTLLIRLNTELIDSKAINDSVGYNAAYSVSSISLPLGFKFVTKNKKWETIILAIPKLAPPKDVDANDFQYGGIFLQHFVVSEKLKIKAGLYYNREAFGDFFVPLVGIDWKPSDRIYFYGVLPSNYKVEFNIVKNRLYTGLNFKSLTRSFSLPELSNSYYVRYDEMQVKLFVDCFVYKKILLFGELGYSLGKSPLLYDRITEKLIPNTIFSPVNNGPVFNIGIAYRIRTDLAKDEVKSE